MKCTISICIMYLWHDVYACITLWSGVICSRIEKFKAVLILASVHM
jgi:hypothetical protein